MPFRDTEFSIAISSIEFYHRYWARALTFAEEGRRLRRLAGDMFFKGMDEEAMEARKEAEEFEEKAERNRKYAESYRERHTKSTEKLYDAWEKSKEMT